MKFTGNQKSLLILFSFLFFSISCQEDVIENDAVEDDEDMLTAIEMADEYLSSSGARRNSKKAITVLKFKDGVLYYDTNTDTVRGYRKVTEETVTAYVDYGENIFWYAGGGVSDLDLIEFDAQSQVQLDEYPEETNENRMWRISIPENREIDEDDEGDVEDEYLKYDIVYKGRDSDTIIRLDPKLKVQ